MSKGHSQEMNVDTTEAFSATRAQLLQARHLPGYLYTSPEIYDQEVEKIFMKDWICVGRSDQYDSSGDYRAFRVCGEPLLICRDDEGQLQAFSNVCRHRGVEVAQGQGNTKSFSCMYHGWLYDLNGKLVGAPHSRKVEGFDFGNCHLPRVKLDTWGGYIFINFDPASVSLSEFIENGDGVGKFNDLFQPEHTAIADEFTFEVDCNWKFVTENLLDDYHALVVHGDSFLQHFPASNQDAHQVSDNGGYYKEYETFTMAPDGLSLFGPMPWLKDQADTLAFSLYMRPTFQIFARHDLIQPWIIIPNGHDKTQITIWTQFPKERFNEKAFKERAKVYADFIRTVVDEDVALLLSLQDGVQSRAFRAGPTVGMEVAIHSVLNYYLDRMFGAN